MDVGSYCTGGSWTTQHARQRAAEGGLEEPLYVLTCDAFFCMYGMCVRVAQVQTREHNMLRGEQGEKAQP